MEDHKEAARTKLNVPILAIGGECSYGGKVFEAWRPLVDDVSQAVVEGAGHWPADENPDELARVLLDFLGRAPRS
jgi:pimeloyl-ACP methyl ester carboxylesterase